MKTDPLARRLAAAALAVSLVALVLAGYAVSISERYLEDVHVLGQSLRARSTSPAPSLLEGPPPQLDTD